MAKLTYELLESLDSTAPIFQQTPTGQRVQVKKIPSYRPTLQETITTKDGISRVIRFKRTANTPYQDEQIEKLKIPANEKFTDSERSAAYFTNGQNITDLISLQDYFKVHPDNEAFDGIRDEGSRPKFRLVDKAKNAKEEFDDFDKRLQAGIRIKSLKDDLGALQALLIRLNGFAFKTPDDPKECVNMLVKFLNDADEAGIEDILKDDTSLNIDEQTTVLIGKLVNADLLSFDAVEGKISKKGKDGKWIVVRDMSNEYNMDEKKRLFSDFLNTADGANLKTDLENDLAGIKVAKSKVKNN